MQSGILVVVALVHESAEVMKDLVRGVDWRHNLASPEWAILESVDLDVSDYTKVGSTAFETVEEVAVVSLVGMYDLARSENDFEVEYIVGSQAIARSEVGETAAESHASNTDA